MERWKAESGIFENNQLERYTTLETKSTKPLSFRAFQCLLGSGTSSVRLPLRYLGSLTVGSLADLDLFDRTNASTLAVVGERDLLPTSKRPVFRILYPVICSFVACSTNTKLRTYSQDFDRPQRQRVRISI